MRKLTKNYLEEFFNNNFIDDDELYDLLLGRTAELSFDQKNDMEATMTIKLKMHEG